MTPAKWARRERERQRTDRAVAKIIADGSLAKSVAEGIMRSFEAALAEGIRKAREKAEVASATKNNGNEGILLYGGAPGGGMLMCSG